MLRNVLSASAYAYDYYIYIMIHIRSLAHENHFTNDKAKYKNIDV